MRLVPVLLLLALALTACGNDDDGGAEPQVFEVQATEEGGESKLTAPGSVRPGAVEIRFSNEGKNAHSLQVVQLGEGHTAEEAKKAGENWGGGGGAPLPEWIGFLGGVGSTKAGGSGISVVDLPAGDYALFDFESDAFAEFTVEGDDGPSLPEVEATIEAVDYDFTATALAEGGQRVLFENTGAEPHHLIAAPMKPGATEAELDKAVKSDNAAPPVDESKAFDAAILSGGESAVIDLRFESGDYALVCYIPDRAGGPPHVAKGMSTVVTVE